MPRTSTDIFIVHVWRRTRFEFASARSATHTCVCLSQRFARSDGLLLPDRPLKGGRRPLGSKKLPPGSPRLGMTIQRRGREEETRGSSSGRGERGRRGPDGSEEPGSTPNSKI